jgi:hypothetical protein
MVSSVDISSNLKSSFVKLFSGWPGLVSKGKEKAGGAKAATKADHKNKEQMSFGGKFFTHINSSLD